MHKVVFDNQKCACLTFTIFEFHYALGIITLLLNDETLYQRLNWHPLLHACSPKLSVTQI